MKVLVTGGAGFIGGHLVEGLLAAGHKVVVLDNFRNGNKLPALAAAAVDLHCGDVCDEMLVAQLAHGCSTIFHFAAVIGVDAVAESPLETMETEFRGLVSVARGAVRHGVGLIVYASTSGVYDGLAGLSLAQEDFVPAPTTSYAVAKHFAEAYLASLFQENGVHSVSLRLFNVYGPRQDTRMVIPRFFQQARNGEPLTVFGNGEQTRDFTFVDDVVRCILAITEHAHGAQIFNISTGQETRIVDVARKIIEILGSPSIIQQVALPGHRSRYEVSRRTGATERLWSQIGFLPSILLDQGLRRIATYLLARSADSDETHQDSEV